MSRGKLRVQPEEAISASCPQPDTTWAAQPSHTLITSCQQRACCMHARDTRHVLTNHLD